MDDPTSALGPNASPKEAARVRLAPLTPGQFDDYLSHALPAYAREKVTSGQWAEAQALELARQEVARVLPQGLSTPHHRLFSLRNGASDTDVGMLWIAEQERGGRRIAYVYDVWVWEAHRRKGYAQAAFLALEGLVHDLGLAGISLHVFGHNTTARALYAKLGYEISSLVLFKEIAHEQP